MEIIKIKTRLGEYWFFKYLLLVDKYTKIDFGFKAEDILILNDSNNTIDSEIRFSWNGIDTHGILFAKETFSIEGVEKRKIYLKGNALPCRIWAF